MLPVYVTCMLPVCYLYVTCMLPVCYLYVTCMLPVCWPADNKMNGQMFSEKGGTSCALELIAYKKPRRMALRLITQILLLPGGLWGVCEGGRGHGGSGEEGDMEAVGRKGTWRQWGGREHGGSGEEGNMEAVGRKGTWRQWGGREHGGSGLHFLFSF